MELNLTALTAFLFAALTFTTGCASGHHYKVAYPEFAKIINQPISTITSYQFVGSTESRAYISLWNGMPTILGGGNHIYSIELDKMPSGLLERLNQEKESTPSPQ